MTTTVPVVDDHALFRDGRTALIGRWENFTAIGAAAPGEEAVRLAQELRAALVLMDVRMDGIGTVEATRRITLADPGVAMLTMSSLGEDVDQALRNGAHGYLSKDEPADRLHSYLPGLCAARRRSPPRSRPASWPSFGLPGGSGRPVPPDHERLPHRERDVLRRVVDGLSNEESAGSPFLSEATVKKQLGSIMTKPHVRNRSRSPCRGCARGLVG